MTITVTVEYPWLESRVLADNPLGDPAVRRLPIILPPDYASAPDRRYPVLLGLAGFTGKGLTLLNEDPWQPNLAQRLERLYAAGMPPVIVALPDCFTRYGGSQYRNSAATGRYEDYLLTEVLPYVDAHYRTIPGPAGHGVFGKSSGGYGAFMLGMQHPDVFGALACHSGDMVFEYCYAPDFFKFCTGITAAGGVVAWWERFAAKVKKSGDDGAVLNILAMAAGYSPDPAAPLGIALPVDLHTAARIPEVWARWLAADPAELAEQYADNLRRLRLLYMDCGTRDEFNLQYGARVVARRLQALDIPHDYEEFEDGHMSVQYRYDVSLPRLARALTPP